MNKIKLGFDIHGVLDAFFDQYYQFISALDDRFEIHIITGIKEELGLKDNPELTKLHYDKWFSIHQYCEDLGNIEIKFDHKNRPLIDPAIWDVQKAEYCAREGILFLIDDSPNYGQYMKPGTIYLQQHNPNREDWRYVAE